MKSLPLNLRKNGFNYTQVLRGQRACIYEQRIDKDLVYYEVFLIKTKPERQFRDKIFEAKEVFPHDEAFGEWAWSYREYKDALQRFNELEQ